MIWPGFSGSSITALSATIGDSNGTANQYGTISSLTSTGKVIPFTSAITNPATSNGMINLNLTATGANIVNMTAGQMTISIGVTKP